MSVPRYGTCKYVCLPAYLLSVQMLAILSHACTDVGCYVAGDLSYQRLLLLRYRILSGTCTDS